MNGVPSDLSEIRHYFRNGVIAQCLNPLRKPEAIVASRTLEFGPWDLPSDPAILQESNTDLTPPAMYFLPAEIQIPP
jgi:hypothetical protein